MWHPFPSFPAHRYTPSVEVPIGCHIVLGALISVVERHLSFVSIATDRRRIRPSLDRLERALALLKEAGTKQVFEQFPLVTGFDARTLNKVYYCATNSLSEVDIRSLIGFQGHLDAVNIPRSNNVESIRRQVGEGLLVHPATGNFEWDEHMWQVNTDAAKVLQATAKNLATLADLLSETPLDCQAIGSEEEE